jgi:hypothetical protein
MPTIPRNAPLQSRTALPILALVWLSAGTAVFGQSRYIGWHSDLKTAAERAAATGKPLMVVFRCVR